MSLPLFEHVCGREREWIWACEKEGRVCGCKREERERERERECVGVCVREGRPKLPGVEVTQSA